MLTLVKRTYSRLLPTSSGLIASRHLLFRQARRFSSSNFNGSNSDYYEVLGVSYNATQEDIKAAFFKLSKQYHPDIAPDGKKESHEERFKLVTNAYFVLRDETRKRDYDERMDITSRRRSDAARGAQAQWKRTAPKRQATEEEMIYKKHFGRSYEEDPFMFYDEKNKDKRRRYEEEMSDLRRRRGERPRTEAATGWNKHAESEHRQTAGEQDGGRGQRAFVAGLSVVGVVVLGALFVENVFRQKKEVTLKKEVAPAKLSAAEIQKNELESSMLRDLEENSLDKSTTEVKEPVLTAEEVTDQSNIIVKKYPKEEPNAIDMLVDYTIFPDIKFYAVEPSYFDVEDIHAGDGVTQVAPIKNIRMNTMITLSLEAERTLKNIYIPVEKLKKILAEKGHYKPPGVLFRYYGYNMFTIRDKPIETHWDPNQKYVSLFDLYFRYTTPLTIRHPEFYEFPVKHHGYIKDTTTVEHGQWQGKVYLNHRSLQPVILNGDEKWVRMFRESGGKQTASEEIYRRIWTGLLRIE